MGERIDARSQKVLENHQHAPHLFQWLYRVGIASNSLDYDTPTYKRQADVRKDALLRPNSSGPLPRIFYSTSRGFRQVYSYTEAVPKAYINNLR